MLRSLRVSHFAILFLAVLLILGSVLLENIANTPPTSSVYRETHTWAAFLNELGFAFFIALVIILAIDQRSREQFDETIRLRITEIQENVFRSTFGSNLPLYLIREVENLVLRADFIRTAHRSSYNFRLMDAREVNPSCADKQIIVLEVITEYRLQNVSGFQKDFAVRIDLEKSQIAGLEGHTYVDQVRIDNTTLNSQEMEAADIAIADSNLFKRFKHTVKNIKPQEDVEIFILYKQIKSLTDVEIWRSFLPSDGMTLSVSLPEGVKSFGAHALHRGELTHPAGGDGAGQHQWVLGSAVLPHQGIVFWWCYE